MIIYYRNLNFLFYGIIFQTFDFNGRRKNESKDKNEIISRFGD